MTEGNHTEEMLKIHNRLMSSIKMRSTGYKKMTNYSQHVGKTVLALTQDYLRSWLRFDGVEYGSEEALIVTMSYLQA